MTQDFSIASSNNSNNNMTTRAAIILCAVAALCALVVAHDELDAESSDKQVVANLQSTSEKQAVIEARQDNSIASASSNHNNKQPDAARRGE